MVVPLRGSRPFGSLDFIVRLFTKKIAVITFGHDARTEGYAVVEKPVIRTFSGQKIIEATHASCMAKYLRSRRILIPLSSVTSITEFDRVSEIDFEDDRRKKKT